MMTEQFLHFRLQSAKYLNCNGWECEMSFTLWNTHIHTFGIEKQDTHKDFVCFRMTHISDKKKKKLHTTKTGYYSKPLALGCFTLLLHYYTNTHVSMMQNWSPWLTQTRVQWAYCCVTHCEQQEFFTEAYCCHAR